MFAIVTLIAASVKLYEKQTQADQLYLILTVIMGGLNLAIGIIMIAAIIKVQWNLYYTLKNKSF